MPLSGRKTLIILSIFILCAAGLSAETLTLDNCIELALKNHPDVISARNSVGVANSELWNAAGAFLPSLSVGGGVSESHYPQEIQTVIGDEVVSSGKIAKNYSLSASARLTIFDGGQNLFNYLAAKANKAYNKYQAEGSEQSLILTVKSYYFAYLAALRIKESREEAVKRGEEQLKLAQSKFEVGSASKSDVLKAKVQYGNDKLDLIDAQNGIEKAFADLAYVIGIDVNSDIIFSPDYIVKDYEGSENDAMAFGLTHYPGLLASEKSMAEAKNNLRSAWGEFLPTVTVSFSKSYQNKFWHVVNDLPYEDSRWSISTSVSLPIFANFSRYSSISRAKANLNNARASYYYAKNNVALEIKKAYLDMSKAREKLTVTEENVAAAEEDMALVQEKYNLGAATILELLDAQVSLITAQYDKIQSEFDYNLAVATLENAMGVR